jgi:hypothetical protein
MDSETTTSEFRYGLHTMTFAATGQTVGNAWKSAAAQKGLDANRPVTFKQGADEVDHDDLVKAGVIYGVTVASSKNG